MQPSRQKYSAYPEILAWDEAGITATLPKPLTSGAKSDGLEHPFGAMKARMGATHFLTKAFPKVAAEMALSVLAYNLTRS